MMGKCSITYDEIRMDVRHPELTEVYVFITAKGDCPFFLQGWHHKSFPFSIGTFGIMQLWNDGHEDPASWPLKAPPSNERNATLDEVSKLVREEAVEATLGTGNGEFRLFAVADRIDLLKT